MITSKQKQEEYYRALKEKDRNYEGIFFAGIKTTGIFCHPTCRARKPKFEHCEFYETALQALSAAVLSSGASGRDPVVGGCSRGTTGKTLDRSRFC